jgi:hypothetical protein
MIYLFSDEDRECDGNEYTLTYFHYFYSTIHKGFYYIDSNESHIGCYNAVIGGWNRCIKFDYELPHTLNIIHTDFYEHVINICEEYVEKLIFDKL